MTIVSYTPKRRREPVTFPLGRIVTAAPPRRRRPFYAVREGMPDAAERAKLIDAFMTRTQKTPP